MAWQYEPDVFPISWNADGVVIESFAPDFYLPEIDLYIELTTLKQSLVRKKNRKLRWMRQLYPEIRVKLFYARDFRALMVKYGRLDFLTDVDASNGAQAMTGNGSHRGNGSERARGGDRRSGSRIDEPPRRRRGDPARQREVANRVAELGASSRPTTPVATRCSSAC